MTSFGPRRRPQRGSRLNASSMNICRALALGASLACLAACAQESPDPGGPWHATVIASYPHDPRAFTQGLVIHYGSFYESTGQYGQSSLRKVAIESGKVERLVPLNSLFFAEGLTILGNRIFQLTWRSNVGFVYDLDSFERIANFRYTGEGWGLTNDGSQLILSDGTSVIRFLDPETFEVERTIDVRDGERRIERLNELEYIDGEIWSNVWYDDRIVRIAPDSGRVLGWIDLSTLYPADQRSSEAVLNGIAYDADNDRLFVTGKNWPTMFEIEVDGR
jgi:glutamine cyclotransferase